MISQLFVLSERGDLIVMKDYRSDLVRNTPELFFRHVRSSEADREPVFVLDGINYLYVKKNGLYFTCTTVCEGSPALALELLVRLVKVIKDFMGQLTEELIRKNFVLVYEIIDEMLDFGHPQLTSTEEIRPMIVNISESKMKLDFAESVARLPGLSLLSGSSVSSKITEVSIQKSTMNSIFLDVIESINIVFNSSGYVINSSVDGCVIIKNFLKGGGAAVRLVLGDVGLRGKGQPGGNLLEDYNFHHCVEDKEFEMARALRITPPQGEFVAMNYRMLPVFNPPFKVVTDCGWPTPYKLELTVRLSSTFSAEVAASRVRLQANVPEQVTSVYNDLLSMEHLPSQRAVYDESRRKVEWELEKMPGQLELVFVCKMTLKGSGHNQMAVKKEVAPLTLSFEIPSSSMSFVKVSEMKVQGPDSGEQKFVRYITRSSNYVCRL
jgi:AP-4 complex subunit mu-1